MALEFSFEQKQKKVFIIGATGFIGFACAKRLVEIGFKNIYCLYRNENKKNEMFAEIDTSAITFLCGDLKQMDVLRQGIQNAEIVINASGIASDWGVKQQIWDVNVNAPKAIIEIIKELGQPTHFIQLSTASVYGYATEVKTEETPLEKNDRFYTASKVDIHAWLQDEINKKLNFPITMIAPSIVWGEGDQIYVPAIKELLQKKQLPYIGTTQEVDFIHIDDLVDGILLCFFNARAYNQDFIISGSNSFTFNRYIEKIAEFSELSPPTFTIPLSIYLAFAALCEYVTMLVNLFNPKAHPLITKLAILIAVETFGLSNTKAKRELGFEPKIDFNTGMERLKDYVKQCSVSKIYH